MNDQYSAKSLKKKSACGESQPMQLCNLDFNNCWHCVLRYASHFLPSRMATWFAKLL